MRWPRGEVRPNVGDRFEGTAIHVTRAEHRERIVVLLHGNILERCEAAAELPIRILKAFYSHSQANNLGRVGRNLCPSLREHVAELLRQGIPVSCNVLFKVVVRRAEADQWAEWRRAQR